MWRGGREQGLSETEAGVSDTEKMQFYLYFDCTTLVLKFKVLFFSLRDDNGVHPGENIILVC